MNRLALLTVACVLLISTVGATATVSATQIGHSPIYYFGVRDDAGTMVGQVIVNTANAKAPTYVLLANGLKPNTKYTFGYTVSRVISTLGSATTTTKGALVMHGTSPNANMKDVQSAQFWVTKTPPGASYAPLRSIDFGNNGWFLAELACDYSTDNGVTWHESGHTKGIPIWSWGGAKLADLGVPFGALVKIHVIVVGGKDNVGKEVFQHYYTSAYESYYQAEYTISGTTLNNKLQYLDYYHGGPA